MTGELISRETAIQTVHETMYQFIDDSETMTDRDGLLLKVNKAICNGLKEIPSVENKGEWLLYGYVSTKQIENCTERYCCSKCHNIISRDFRYFKFCPNCGADMRGE
jgi:translation initiation factor 2 beta subunit (eIF-2beta)/eIF-5